MDKCVFRLEIDNCFETKLLILHCGYIENGPHDDECGYYYDCLHIKKKKVLIYICFNFGAFYNLHDNSILLHLHYWINMVQLDSIMFAWQAFYSETL